MISNVKYTLNIYKNLRFIYLNRKYFSIVPAKPVVSDKSVKARPVTRIDKETISLLEQLSLVDFGNEKGIEIVEEAIRFADKLDQVDTEGVEPLSSVLEDRDLRLRDDIVSEGNITEEILSNAKLTEDDYLVAPPGNIPLDSNTYQRTGDSDPDSQKNKASQ